MIYIVTGASGFLGNNIVKLLSMYGKKIRALVLPKDQIDFLKDYDIEIFYGDVTNKESLLPLFKIDNTDFNNEDICVIHTAGIVSISSNKNDLMERVNIEGTRNLLELSKNLKIGHFVYVSSVHAIPEPKEDVEIIEIDEFNPNLVYGEYAKTKAIATSLVLESGKLGLPVSIVHPSGIIGPFDYGKTHMTELIEKYMNGKLNTRVNGHYDFVDVRDVAFGILQIVERKALGCYILSGEKIQIKEFFNIMFQISGKKRRPNVVATWFVKMIAPMIEYAYRVKKQIPLFSKYSLYTLNTKCNFSHKKATSQLGYQPRNIKKTIIDTVLWLIEQKRINKPKIVSFITKRLNIN